VAHERGQPEAGDMLAEVLSLADLAGMRQFVEDAHPRLADMLARRPPAGRVPDVSESIATPQAQAPSQTAQASAPSAVPSGPAAAPQTGGLLTPKEARILSMLAVGRANKEIARAMDIGEQTVKWHLKNVFFKLNAASRKHAVDRARLLGLLHH